MEDFSVLITVTIAYGKQSDIHSFQAQRIFSALNQPFLMMPPTFWFFHDS
jgi:hypothetical protein